MPLWLRLTCYFGALYFLCTSIWLWLGFVPWPFNKLFRKEVLWPPFKSKDRE
jgi:hypothetical protein